MAVDHTDTYNNTTTSSPALLWTNIGGILFAVAIFIFCVILMVAIFLDRRAYEKTRSFLLLNYLFNYIMFAIFFYLQNVHIHIFQDIPQSSCLFIITFSNIFDDGTSYFILPFCLDFVVKYFKPIKYESRKYLHIQYILTFALWAFVWLKNLIIIVVLSTPDSVGCSLRLASASLWIHYITTILLVIVMVVFLGLLIYIAVKGLESGLTKSPLITLIVIDTVFVVLYVPENIVWAAMYGAQLNTIIYLAYFSLNMIRFLVVPFLFLPDATIRQSLWKLCSCKCKALGEHSPHQLENI